MILSVQEHVKVLDVPHLGLDVEDVRKGRHNLDGKHIASFLGQEALDDLAQTVTSAILGGNALDVDSTGFQPLGILDRGHLFVDFLVCSLCLSPGRVDCVDREERVDEDHEDVEGAGELAVELLVFEGEPMEEDFEAPVLLLVDV